jgi:hypothetical protein
MGDEIGFVTSRTSTTRTDMVLAFGTNGYKLREASIPSLRAKRSNPELAREKNWIASSLRSSQ